MAKHGVDNEHTDNRNAADQRDEFRRGLPGYHDPTAGIGGAAPAYSALSVRLVLAIVALVLAIGVAVLGIVVGAPGLYWSMLALILLVLVDLVVIIRRKRRGEPG